MALLLLFLALNAPLVTGHAMPLWDADAQFAPHYTLVADYARAGRVLLWNPWTNAGSPDFAEPQLGTLSPLVVAMGALTGGTSLGFRWYWLSVWFLSGLGLLTLGRYLGAPVWGAMVVALGFLFSGFLIGHAEHTAWLQSVAWLSFVIWRLDVALSSRRSGPAFEAGALWGLSGLAGYPGLMALTGGYALLWALGRWACPDSGRRCGFTEGDRSIRLDTVARSLAIVVLVSIVVVSPTYVGFLTEGRGFSDRAEPLPRDVAVGSNALHPRALATVFSPYLGSLDGRVLWPYTDISSTSIYTGAGVLWLALVALVLRPRSAWRWWLTGTAILFLALSLGQSLPLRGWLYDLVPPTRYFRHATMFRVYAMFSLGVLALIATRDLASREATGSRHVRWRLVVSAAIVACLAIVVYHVILGMAVDDGGPRGHLRRLAAEAHLWTVWLGVVGAGVAGGLLGPRKGAAVVPVTLLLLSLLDAVGAHRLPRTLWNRDPAAIESWRRIDAGHDANLELTAKGTDRVTAFEDPERQHVTNKNLPSKTAILAGYSPFSNRLHDRWVQHPLLRRAATENPRFWFAREAADVAPVEAEFEEFVKRTVTMGAPPLIIHSPGALATTAAAAGHSPIRALPAATRMPVALRVYRGEQLTFDADVPSDGWLLVTDRWAGGWRATVNGRPVRIERGNFIFRAVPVTAGLNRIDFTYLPYGWPWLVLLSWGTLAAIALTAAIRLAKAARDQAP
jgi:hypothetical protein